MDRVVGLADVRVDVAMARTPDGHGRLELTKFHPPTAVSAEPNAPPNTLGIRRIMFAVEDIEDILARLHAHGAELVGELEQYEDSYRLCYARGPEGIIVALAEPSSSAEAFEAGHDPDDGSAARATPARAASRRVPPPPGVGQTFGSMILTLCRAGHGQIVVLTLGPRI